LLKEEDMREISVKIGDGTLRAEVAATADEIERGLSGRDGLPWERGMLFVERRSDFWSYWMEGMRSPLDFIWVSDGKNVVDVTENVPLHSGEGDPPFITPRQKARYVIEVNAGWVAAHGIKIGDKVEFEV
jgi:uncharacterized membrane protein (UPF0127 family)